MKPTNDFEKCCKGKKLVKVSYASALIQNELGEAEHDLNSARDNLSRAESKWSIVPSYYSMFHAARALLLSKGFREKSHNCLCIGVKHFFVEENLMSIALVEHLNMAKKLREAADYENQYSSDAAEVLLEYAKEFLETTKRLLMPEDPAAPK
jgi:uncharacterized protein (UPF0332 family)